MNTLTPEQQAQAITERTAALANGSLDISDADYWAWQIPMAILCSTCDGKDEPDPNCEWCFGTGVDHDLAGIPDRVGYRAPHSGTSGYPGGES